MNREEQTTSVDRPSERVLTPRVSIHETGDAVVVQAEMPGVAKEGLSVSVDGDQLQIRGHKAERKPVAGATVLQRETRDGIYERTFTLGEQIDRGRITAEMKQGLLSVVLGKAETAKPRTVEVHFH